MTLLKKLGKAREISSLFFLIFLFGLVGLVNSDFLTPTSLFNCFNDSVVFTMLAVGISFVILTGEIDVSIGATLGLSAAVSSTILRDGGSGIVAVLAAVLIGCLVGLFNGLGIAKLGIPSLIFTLGTNGLVRGLVYVYTGGAWVENLPAGFTKLANVKLIGELTTFYAAALVLVIASHLILTKTRRGKYFITVGDNPAGATMVGIPTMQTKIMAYVLCGLFASVAGVLYSSRIGFITPTAGNGYEMKAIAACVLGGVSLSGGLGSLIGASIGAVIMSSISRILVFLGFSSDYDNTITGILLIVIVVVDAVAQNRAAVKTRHARLASRSGPLEEEPKERGAAS
ncbi:ABC transporter permease [Faecalispora anaeroviscerum]|uniref:ABC transporter permease n=1 Tax=Faecalispora anaeroviscerum TaxID=2991836 RepID=UPI0024B9D037|nr:ABC transporter permease [Faecalispora anaeroviscerum]